MPFEIIRHDITKLHVDAIICAANKSLLGGGGADGAIHRAAGCGLLRECRVLGGCKVGEAKITKGYNLPAKYIIHTVGPVWNGGNFNEEKLLQDCYNNSLMLAKKHKLKSVAFPLISSGAFGYPKDRAIRVAVSTISGFLMHDDMMVYLVVYDKTAFSLSEKLFATIKQYIDDNYVDEDVVNNTQRDMLMEYTLFEDCAKLETCMPTGEEILKYNRSLDDIVAQLDDTFSERLLRLIDERGKGDVEIYKKANIDRKLFSKIKSDKHYKPSKPTVLAFSMALELSLDETKDLLKTTGFALSRSDKFDVIIEYFIERGIYNVFEVNEALFAFEQSLLGV